jgi:glycosyltransferase involved in cell wall biosynthesis
MRVLFINHNVVQKGGTYYRAFHAGRYLVRRGHSVTLLSISANNRWEFIREVSEGVEIIHTPDLLWGLGRTGWDIWDTLWRLWYLRNKGFDIIHAYDSRPAVIIPALFCRKMNGGKLILDWADWWSRGGTQAERAGWVLHLVDPVETFFEEAFRTTADGTTVASAALRERAIRLGVPAFSILVLPGGSEIDIIRPTDKLSVRAALHVADHWTVGCIGALTPKDAHLLAETLQIARLHIPNLQLLAIGISIAGSKSSFRAITHLEDDWVVETGRVPFYRIGSCLAACDALLLPLWDNLANTARWPSRINDYLASGRPIVATRVGEISALSEKYTFGLATEPTAQALADGLMTIYQNPALAKKYGENARLLAEGDLNWARLSEQLEAFYMKIINGSVVNPS